MGKRNLFAEIANGFNALADERAGKIALKKTLQEGKVQETMILFLDFDGVLHPLEAEAAELFSCLQKLWTLLRRHPEIDVVFSTAWRSRLSLSTLREYVTMDGGEDLAPRFIATTTDEIDHVSVFESRLIECKSWLAENAREQEPWIALDDMAVLFGHKPAANVYIVNSVHGLLDHDVEAISALIRRLS